MPHGCQGNWEKELHRSFLLLKLLGAGLEEKGRFLQAVGGVDVEPAPPLCPSLAVSECHVSAVFCRPPQFHGATSSYPRGPFHFLDVKATCSFKTTSLAPFLPHAEGGAGVWSARSSSPLWLTRGRLWSFLARAGRTFMPVLTEGLWCAQHRTWAVMGGPQGVQSARGHRAVTSAQGGRGRRYRMRANSML